MTLAVGTKLGPYEIVAAIGAGGMGEVYKARDRKLDRFVAVKVISEKLSGDADALARFEREAKAVAALSHPNILAIHDFGSESGVSYAVMELLEGETLRERLSNGPLAPAKAQDVGIQMASGLAAAHEKGIVHRDLKPANVFLTRAGHVKILDFGLAKLRPQEPLQGERLSEIPTAEAPTSAGAVLGTVGYMAPEQARGLPADARSDIFAFGVVLYEMLAGKRAFAGDTASDTLAAILMKDPDPLPAITPPGLDRVVRRCLEKRPDDRFSSAHDLVFALEAVAGSGAAVPVSTAPPSPPAVAASVPPAPEPAADRWLRRHWVKLFAGVAAVTLVAAAAGWAVWFRNGKAAPENAAPNPKRVAVAVFENQTGDRSLDSIGRMATDSLTQGLSKITEIETVPTSAGAGKVVSGTYYLQGQTLRFQVKVTDASTGQIIYAPEPFTGAREESQKIIDDLDQHMMGAIAAAADGSINPQFITPPTYEAYREYVAGRQGMGSDWVQAIGHFERAAKIDPDFAYAWITIAWWYNGYGEFEKSDTVLSRLNEHRERLTPFEQDTLDAYRAQIAGQYPVALARLGHAAKLDPKNENNLYMVGVYALFANMPRLVLETLPDPTRVFQNQQARSGLAPYSFTVIADACHLLSDYRRELEVADKGIPLFPDTLEVRFGKVRACAGLGRTEEVGKLVDETLGASFADGTPDDLMLLASLELRSHGNTEAARRMATRSVDWLRGRPAAEQSKEQYRSALARALYSAERWEEAHVLYQQLSKEHPLAGGSGGDRGARAATTPVPESRLLGAAIGYVGPLGTLAARRGDRKEALRISDELARIDYKYLFGSHTYWRACIAAQLGDKEQATELLRQSASQGYLWAFPGIGQCGALGFHASMDLEPLHGYPPYEELLKPKG